MKKKDFLFIFIIIIFGFILYANSLDNSFVWDDWLHIVQNNFIKDWGNIDKLFSKDYFELSGEGFPLSWRPLTTFSYFINYSLWGLNPFGYHLSSLFNHLLNAVLVYLITFLLFQKRRISFLAGLFFVSHPIATEAVCVISFNENLLACLFLLLSFYSYIKSQGEEKSRKSLMFLWCISNLFYLLALLSKEVAIVLPLIILAYDYCFVSEKNGKIKGVKEKIFFYSGYIIIAVFYFSIRIFLLKDIQRALFCFVNRECFLYKALLEIIFALANFIKLLVFPLNLSSAYFITTIKSLFEPRILFSMGIVLFVAWSSFFIYKYSKKFFWSILWVFLNIFPILIIIPSSYLFAERYLYIPLIGFCILLAIGIDKGLQRKRLFCILMGCILLFYSLNTVKRNNDWQNDDIMFSKKFERYPNNFCLYNKFGQICCWQGKYSRACGEYKKALKLNPYYVEAWFNLANVYMLEGEYFKAIKAVKEVLKLNPEHVGAHNNLGIYYTKIGLYNKAIQEYDKALKLEPLSAGIYKNIGDLYRTQKMDDKAIKAYKYALKLNPQYSEVQDILERIYENRAETK